MQTNPESAAVEAVAWQARINEGHEWQSISEEAYKSITGWDKRALVPQSALDALRGEVAELKQSLDRLSGMKFSDRMHAALVSRADAAERRVAELEKLAEAVTWFDWSDNDEDAVQAIDSLRNAIEAKTE